MNRTKQYCLFIITTGILLLDALTPFVVNNLKIYLLIFFISASTFIVIITRHLLKWTSKDLIPTTILVVGLLCFAKYFFSWGGDWKTQTIIYQNLHLKKRTIEFQMRDVGALGYKKRTVDRIRLIPFFDWITKTDIQYFDTLVWRKVEIYVNDFGLKGG